MAQPSPFEIKVRSGDVISASVKTLQCEHSWVKITVDFVHTLEGRSGISCVKRKLICWCNGSNFITSFNEWLLSSTIINYLINFRDISIYIILTIVYIIRIKCLK